jgi:hypothetical protein
LADRPTRWPPNATFALWLAAFLLAPRCGCGSSGRRHWPSAPMTRRQASVERLRIGPDLHDVVAYRLRDQGAGQHGAAPQGPGTGTGPAGAFGQP